MMYLPYITPYHSLWGARTIFARLQGEDKASPLLCYEQVATSSIVGAMACPRPARANASLVRTQAHCNNRTRTLFSPPPCVYAGIVIACACLLKRVAGPRPGYRHR